MKTKSYRYTSIWFAALALAVACEKIRAADFHVATAQGLQNALTAAAHNGTDNNIYVTNGYYEGNFNYNSSGTNNLTLLAEPGLTNTGITIDGAGAGRGLTISSSAVSNTITVQGISFAIDYGVSDAAHPSEGALLIGAGSLATISVSSCGFFSSGSGDGDGLDLVSGLNAIVSGCTVSGALKDNQGYGGYGIFASSQVSGEAAFTGSITVQNCTFSTNQVYGLYVADNAGSFTVSNSVFSGNVNGGISFSGYGYQPSANVAQCTFNGNGAITLEGGGGASLVCAAALNLTGNTFTWNTVNYRGVPQPGGGVNINGINTVNVASNTFIGDVATTTGGGIAITESASDEYPTTTVRITGNQFLGNSASVGGAVFVDVAAASATIQANKFDQNTADGEGGAVYISATAITISDNLVVGNMQTNRSANGGGFWVAAATDLFFINNTITGNTSAAGGGGVAFQVDGEVPVLNVFNNIIWGNSGKSGADVWLAGTGEERIFSFNDADGFFGIWDLFENDLDVDPRFVDAANGNYHLQSGSLCIDAGTNGAPSQPATDLDGNPRVVGGNVDMGCYEFLKTSSGISLSIQPVPTTNGVLLQWPNVAGVNYAIQKSTNLSNGFFDVTSSFTTTGSVNTYADVPAPGTPAAFYRIRSW